MISESRVNITAHAGCMGTELDSIESIEAGLDKPKLDTTKLNNKGYLAELFDELKSLNIMGININYRFVTPEIINICKEN